MLQLEVDAALVRLVSEVAVPDQVQTELLAILFVTVELVECRRRLVVLVLENHRVQLSRLSHDPWRVVVPRLLLRRRAHERLLRGRSTGLALGLRRRALDGLVVRGPLDFIAILLLLLFFSLLFIIVHAKA